VLAISGGAANGSLAAGTLTGWTEAGTRPQFHVVSGVSVGALAAPFAFLGPTYDKTLRALFTRLATADLFREKPGLVAYFSDSLASAQPLASLISEFIDEPLSQATDECWLKNPIVVHPTNGRWVRRNPKQHTPVG